jgi:alkyldihydroxyacetonephosphate synthase
MPLLPRPPAAASLIVDLARIVGASNVSNLDADRIAYARDSWPRDVLLLRAGQIGAAPSCIVWPESPEDVARILQFSQQAQVPVVPYGAGSGVCGGARPTEGGIVIDLKRMRAIRELDGINLRAEVEAGIIGERLERTLNAKGFTLGHFPSSIICSTLGGWLAARSAGQMSTLYGKIEDMTFGLEVASPGRVRRSMLGPRPPDGPDFNALVIGSEGTFGVITAAQLRIRPLPEQRLFRGFRFPNVKSGVEAIRKILRANIRPAVVRLYDALDTMMGRGHGEDDEAASEQILSVDVIAQRAQGWVEGLTKRFTPGAAQEISKRIRKSLMKSTVKAVMGAPLVLNRAIDVLPEDCLLVLGFEGQHALVKAELDETTAFCVREGATDLGAAPGEHWYKNRYAVSFKASKMYASGIFVDTMEVAATWDRILPLYHAVRKAISRDAIVMAHFSHAYGEGCSVYFSFAGAATDPADPAEAIERYDRIWKNALIAVHETGGTISHHHGVGESKAQGMAREHGPGGMRMLNALKEAFDPKGLINPKKLGLEIVRRPPPRRRSSIVAETEGFPKEIAVAVGERNIVTSGSRTTVRPPDEGALAALLRVAAPRSLPVVSDQTGFRAPAGAVLLDLRRFEGVSRVSEHSLFVEVEAGVIVERLERMLNAHRLTLGHLHPRAIMRSVGAALSRNLLIRRGIAFGDLRDVCFAARGLLANGAPIETRPVPRSATGPELDRALVGAQGRFGIITKATLRIAEMPAHVEEVVYEFASLDAAVECARVVLHRGVRPTAARVIPEPRGAAAAFELAAAFEAVIRGQLAIVASAAHGFSGQRITTESLALGGRFDAVVEVAQRWHKAVTTLDAMKVAAEGAAWMDFLGPEGCTIVARVQDADARRAVTEAGARMGGRVVAGTRASDIADLESFATSTGDHWRETPAAVGERRHDPYEDVMTKLSSLIDPTGVFRGR